MTSRMYFSFKIFYCRETQAFVLGKSNGNFRDSRWSFLEVEVDAMALYGPRILRGNESRHALGSLGLIVIHNPTVSLNLSGIS